MKSASTPGLWAAAACAALGLAAPAAAQGPGPGPEFGPPLPGDGRVVTFRLQRGPGPGQPPGQPCDRACLAQMLEDYLTALKAHDPAKLPLAPSVRFTENNSPLNLPDGLWNTVDKISDYRLPVLEPENGNAALFTTVEEHGKPAFLSVRLKVFDKKISEIETIVLRPQANNGFGQPKDMPRRPAFYEDVPADKRLSRVQLASIANSYFETLQQNHGVLFAPFAATCHRLENGVATTNNNTPAATGRPDPAGIKKMGCEQQFKTGYFNFVTWIRDRRPLVVDREKGLVFMAGFFDHKGDVRAETLSNGQVVDPQFDTPWTWQIGEIFKIKDNKIAAAWKASSTATWRPWRPTTRRR